MFSLKIRSSIRREKINSEVGAGVNVNVHMKIRIDVFILFELKQRTFNGFQNIFNIILNMFTVKSEIKRIFH